jgi:hypothetical protein
VPRPRWHGTATLWRLTSRGSFALIALGAALWGTDRCPETAWPGRAALPLEPGDGGRLGMPQGRLGQAAERTKSARLDQAAARARLRCRVGSGEGLAVGVGWRRPGLSCPTWTCTAPRPAPHVRDLAGGQRHPGAGDRRADGSAGRPPWRARRQHDRQRYRHMTAEMQARGGSHWRSAGRGAGRHAPGVPQGRNSGGGDRVRARATGRVTCGGVGGGAEGI